MPTPPEAGYETLALLLRPQGRRGELLAELHTGDAARLAAATTAFLLAPHAAAPAPGATRRTIESMWQPTGKNAGRIVLKLAGCDTISDAELLAQHTLVIPLAEPPRPADADTFYVSDLVGCMLYNAAHLIGEVVDIEFATAPDGRTRLLDTAPLLVVEPSQTSPALDDSSTDDGEVDQLLIPFVRAQLIAVDLTARTITMDLPEGLLDLT